MEIAVYYIPDIRIPCLTVLCQGTVALISMLSVFISLWFRELDRVDALCGP